MKLRLSLFTLIIFSISASSQNFQWAKSMGGIYDDISKSIAVDGSGNIYTTGCFMDTIDLNPGVGVNNLTSAGGYDIFISKLDASGNFVWAKSMGGPDNDGAYSITTDASGNVYTTGGFSGTADFDPGVGVSNLTSSGFEDVFISKLDASGNFVWAKRIGEFLTYIGYSISVDVAGNVYITGFMGGNIFISKLDVSGNLVWTKTIWGDKGMAGSSIALDASGNIYITGILAGMADFDPGPGTFNLRAVGSSDIFILKLDASGNFVWAKNMGGTNDAHGQSIAIDGSGNVCTTGNFYGTVDFNPGTGVNNLTSAGLNDVFILKLDASGNFLWVKSMGGTNEDGSASVAVDGSGNIYTTGVFMDTADFDPGAGVNNLISAGGYDIFISKLDASGNFVWAKRMGGTNYEQGNSLAVDVTGNIYTTGGFRGTADFDPGAGVNNLISKGSTDIFVSKLCIYNVGINESSNQNLFSVFPNPATNQINIEIDASLVGSAYAIYDEVGKTILNGKLNSEKTNIDLNNLAAGIYLFNVEGNAKRTYKFIKQ
jgi:hypothetical protein